MSLRTVFDHILVQDFCIRCMKDKNTTIEISEYDSLRKSGNLINICGIGLSYGDTEENDYVPIEIKNVAFPLAFLGDCAVLTIVIRTTFFIKKD